VSEIGAERREQVWRGTDVSLVEVLRQINRLRMEAAREEAVDLAHIHPRNSVLDIVTIADGEEEAEHVAGAIEDLALRHPCRAVIVLAEPGRGATSIDATITSIRHELVAGAICQYEQIFLRARGGAADHIPSLVEPLLIPDVDTYLWWAGSPPVAGKRFKDALQVADRVLVDSSRFERPYEGFADLAELEAGGGTRLGDFQWARLHPWREVLAQFFNPPDRRGFLRGIGAVGIDYAAQGRGNRTAALLFSGWLAAALGWRLRSAAAGSGGVMVAYFTSPGDHPVEVQIRPVAVAGFADGELAALRVDAVWQSRHGYLSATRDREIPSHVITEGQLWGMTVPRRVLPIESATAADLLSLLLMDGTRGDGVYQPALAAGGEILKATA